MRKKTVEEYIEVIFALVKGGREGDDRQDRIGDECEALLGHGDAPEAAKGRIPAV